MWDSYIRLSLHFASLRQDKAAGSAWGQLFCETVRAHGELLAAQVDRQEQLLVLRALHALLDSIQREWLRLSLSEDTCLLSAYDRAAHRFLRGASRERASYPSNGGLRSN